MLRVIAFVLPLGLDSFAVAAALGAGGLVRTRDRLRVSLIFVVFEAGMPLIGLAAGGAASPAPSAASPTTSPPLPSSVSEYSCSCTARMLIGRRAPWPRRAGWPSSPSD
ncbi:MAG TPA: hypothetical protein VGI66_08795 [Streptosporangiaceae bacterium]